MSEADEKLVREVFARWNRGRHDVDPELLDPEIEIHSALVRAVFRGYRGAETWVREIDEQFGEWKIEIEALQRLDDGRLVVEGTIHGRGRLSGVDLDEPASWLVEIREGRVLRLLNFIGREAAAEAAGER